MGLVDAYARLQAANNNKVLLIHVDRTLPLVYNEFKDEQQSDFAIAMVLSLSDKTPEKSIQLEFNACNDQQENFQLPGAICFDQWLKSEDIEFTYSTSRYQYSGTKNV